MSRLHKSLLISCSVAVLFVLSGAALPSLLHVQAASVPTPQVGNRRAEHVRQGLPALPVVPSHPLVPVPMPVTIQMIVP